MSKTTQALSIVICSVQIITLTGIQEQLPFYKETDHFKIFCFDTNNTDVDEIIGQQELFFTQLTQDFNHQYTTKIDLYICPDLTFLHNAIGNPDAPDWVIGSCNENEQTMVTPSNPGPKHTYASVLRACKVNLATLFITNKYPHHATIPRWLHQGVALFKANFFSINTMNNTLQQCINHPTIEQLDTIGKVENQKFEQVNGFKISTSLVHFINTQWGWQTILLLLNDYTKFESILGMTKDAFKDEWIKFLQKSPSINHNSIEIRLITHNELNQYQSLLYNVYNTAFTEIYKDYLTSQFLYELKERFYNEMITFSEATNDMFLFIAYQNQKIVGFSLFKKIGIQEVSLELIAITPYKWRCGIGKKLVFAIHDILPSHTIKVVTFKINPISPKFYTALGFSKTDYIHTAYNADEIQGFEYRDKNYDQT